MTENEAQSVLGLTGKLAGSLPGQFLALLMVNVLLVGGMFWLEDSRNERREHVLLKLLDTCAHDGTHSG